MIQNTHEDEDCLAAHRPGLSAFTLITLGRIGQRPKGHWFRPKAAASKLGLDTIGIVAKSGHRYPRSVLAPLVPGITAHSQVIRVGYRSLIGAFGTLVSSLWWAKRRAQAPSACGSNRAG
jgi:hypothetical protein